MADYEGTCLNCKYAVPHRLNGELTGYGYCTKHTAYQLKTPDDSAVISNTPIIWHECTCKLGEPKE